MKNHKTLLLAIASLLFSQLLFAQCNPAAVSYTGTTPTFTFSADSAQTGDTLIWDFEDGTTSNLTNPTHTFQYNGHYWVHLSVQNGNCWDTGGVAVDVTNLLPAPCDPTFTRSNSGNTYTFTTTNPQPYYNYYWNFGDGTTSNSSNPVHTYINNGSYTVTCTLQNYYIYLCTSSQSDTIVINNIACNAQFNESNYMNSFEFSPTFVPSNPVGSYTRNWDFGDGSTSVTTDMSSQTHVYSSLGNYTVTCILTDGSCSDTVTSAIVVSSIYTATCNANFTTTSNDPNFTFQLNNTSAPITYVKWDFGDGNGFNWGGDNQTHHYNNNGTYTVRCAVIDSIVSCTDTSFTTVTVANIGGTTIKGTVSMGNISADYAKVYLISYDSVLGTLTAFDSTTIGTNGFYSFTTVTSGKYLVKAGLLSSSAGYSSYLPTYYYNTSHGELLWSNARFAYSPNNNPVFNIPLVSGTNPGGSAFVGGLISQGANKVGDPIENVMVMVTDLGGNPINFGFSDATGHFNISSLPYGDYLLYPEVTGKTTTPMQFTLSASNPDISSFVVEVNSTTVEVSIVSGIEKINPFQDVSLYPNPIQNTLTIDFGKTLKTEVTIEILDVAGRVLLTQKANGNSHTLINTSQLSQGTYLLRINGTTGSQVFKVVK